MPYVSSIEPVSHCKGLCRGIEALLKVRFGEEGLKLMPEIREICEEEKLEAILVVLEAEANLDAVRPLCAPNAP